MKYIDHYNQLKTNIDLNQEECVLPDSMIRIRNFIFRSGSRENLFAFRDGRTNVDTEITENIEFRYSIFLPDNRSRYKRAILFLHGLNERTWNKHYAAAKFLCEKTRSPVIMFPLSYHINRGLPAWADARKMANLLEFRKKRYPGVRESSLANLVLSERLTECPERFFISGYQSAMDVTHLISDITTGNHPVFEPGAATDLFAYSISCLLLEVLMISNPGGILTRSKIVFFAGGSFFSHMQGISRYIMDSVAFNTIRDYYLNHFSKRSHEETLCSGYHLGDSFRSLISPKNYNRDCRMKMEQFKGQMLVIALRDDKIIPVEGIRCILGEPYCRSGHFRIVHFPYPYIHENPFPVLNHHLVNHVERAFHMVFDPTVRFLVL
jgi:hypothetical protein